MLLILINIFYLDNIHKFNKPQQRLVQGINNSCTMLICSKL